jgi:hypothetical protein
VGLEEAGLAHGQQRIYVEGHPRPYVLGHLKQYLRAAVEARRGVGDRGIAAEPAG